jgi:hypothetical protein
MHPISSQYVFINAAQGGQQLAQNKTHLTLQRVLATH